MQRLGGWWRLWIVVSVVWLSLMFIVTVPLGSLMSQVGDDLLVGAQVANRAAEFATIRARVGSQCLPGTVTLAGGAKVGNPFDAFDTYEEKPKLTEEQLGYPPLPPGFVMDQPAQPAKPMPYMRVLTTCMEWSRLAQMLILFLSIPLFLLGVSLAGRWIWRGFRRDSL